MQEKQVDIVSNFTEYIRNHASYAENMPAQNYETIYKDSVILSCHWVIENLFADLDGELLK